jgi:hypothetical protein
MTYQNQNEAGEWLIDGAALRFEAQLDAEYAEEAARMAYDDDYYSDYPEECPDCGADDPDDCTCDDDSMMDPFVMEDQWLDGSYEE